MRKILFAIIFIFTAKESFACVCAPEIIGAFEAYGSLVEFDLERHSNALKMENIKEAKRANAILEENLVQVQKLIDKEKNSALKRQELINELRKKIKLMD